MSRFAVLNFLAHFCLLWYYFSVYFYKLLRLLNAACDFFPQEGEKKTCLPDTFQKEDINRVFFVFLISSINLLGEIQGLCQNFKCILGGDK